MADEQQLAFLRQGSDAWNAWRNQNREVLVDLFGAGLSEGNLGGVHLYQANLSAADLAEANLSGASLSKANLFNANLTKANLTGADLTGADLSKAGLSLAKLLSTNLTQANLTQATLTGANLTDALLIETNLGGADVSGANLGGAYLIGANLTDANLGGANLTGANLTDANLGGANLTGANLTRAKLVGTNLEGANLTGCRVYGISAWNLKLKGAEQKNLIITPYGEPEITVDSLDLAQFIFLLLNNERVRHVIDTITSKVVLILGRFRPERKVVLDALREELRQRDYTPVLFDFEKPASRSAEETVSTLAHMARFVIADLTDAKSVLQELRAMCRPAPRCRCSRSSSPHGRARHVRLLPPALLDAGASPLH